MPSSSRYAIWVSLEAFGVKNLRCLKDTGLVPIRPITVLVGRNSSGKSTFLRAFPLLRQSVETSRNSPILWYLERYVDFGSLKDAAASGLPAPQVTFQFALRLPTGAHISIDDPIYDISVTLTGGEVPYVSAYEICAEGHDIRWDLDSTGRLQSLRANDQIIKLEGALCLGGKAYLLPTLQPGEGLSASYHQMPEELDLDPIDYQTKADTFQFASSVMNAQSLGRSSTGRRSWRQPKRCVLANGVKVIDLDLLPRVVEVRVEQRQERERWATIWCSRSLHEVVVDGLASSPYIIERGRISSTGKYMSAGRLPQATLSSTG